MIAIITLYCRPIGQNVSYNHPYISVCVFIAARKGGRVDGNCKDITECMQERARFCVPGKYRDCNNGDCVCGFRPTQPTWPTKKDGRDSRD